MNKIRKMPPVCLIIAIGRLISGRLRCSGKHNGRSIFMENDNYFKVFRQIHTYPTTSCLGSCVFIVQFKFTRLSFRGNKLASIIPMLIIAGFPGFQQKIYAVNKNSDYWQGMYQWQSKKQLDAYKKSLVFRIMNKRAVPGSVRSFEILNYRMDDFLKAIEINSKYKVEKLKSKIS